MQTISYIKQGYDSEVKLKHFVARHQMFTKILENHPEKENMLKRKIERNKEDIIEYVLSEKFAEKINRLDL